MALKEKKAGKGHLRPKKLIVDDSIMGTNNSSIVSKRSVERLYYPNEPHFFRYFVKKPQRRAPLINRGYWLRMKAIDHVAKAFLEEKTAKQKVVINLGAGYDPLPWQCWTRYPEQSKGVKFVDIDYNDLQMRKREMVKNTTELNNMLENLTYPTDGDVMLRSDQYVQIGCDLRDLTKLRKILSTEFDLGNTIVFCTAEVSIAYMDVASSDALIKFIGGLPEARFCLLEQLVPHGPNHPFAKTMLAHFDKLGTTLKPVLAYQTTKAQEKRFTDAGWPTVRARSLWELWGSDDFLTPEERIAVDEVEPFDEWEEFALFGCHYTLLTAHTKAVEGADATSIGEPELLPGQMWNQSKTASIDGTLPSEQTLKVKVEYSENPKNTGIRRFAAPLSMRGLNGHPDLQGNFGGHGLNNRLDSIDIYQRSGDQGLFFQSSITSGPISRMCHTITDLGDAGSLLVGGRTSPDRALADCWLYSKLSNTWERVDDLPIPMYRHSAVALGDGHVLVTAGKQDTKTIIAESFIWNRTIGWKICESDWSIPWGVLGVDYPSVFGALVSADSLTPTIHPGCEVMYYGSMAGGITEDGRISKFAWRWTLKLCNDCDHEVPSMVWTLQEDEATPTLCRFGASNIKHAGMTTIIGGIVPTGLLSEEEDVVFFDAKMKTQKHSNVAPSVTRPLLVGQSVASTKDGIVVMGGGAVCFSMGTFVNKGCFTITPARSERGCYSFMPRSGDDETECICDTLSKASKPYQYLTTLKVKPEIKTNGTSEASLPTATAIHKAVVVRRRKIASSAEFSSIMTAGQPVIIEGLDLGSCTKSWTDDYLLEKIGKDRFIVVHQATTPSMDFVSKNFTYESKTFGTFLESVNNGEKLYLRSLAADKPADSPADIVNDFPEIAPDFALPDELMIVRENKHSCPLRISGPVNMWLHYDVMANVLCQIRGTKRLLLYPPSDVPHFSFAPGASSSSIDAFSSPIAGAHPHEVIMIPGDVLYLPPLWLHTAQPLVGVSVSVNVFFRDGKSGYAAGKDVYGNRDLQAYEKGRLDIGRMAKSFDGLDDEMKKFYLLRLADELMQKAKAA